jgi:glycosyltransferase involved in cell wall biosynthesis
VTDVVIPARNEADTIGPIIRAFFCSDYCQRVIVVDDRSSDNTRRVASAHGATIVDGPGLGKGQAMMTGISYTSARRVCFCDGDLRGFQPWHADILLRPSDGEIIGRVNTQLAWSLSGQRSLPRGLIAGLYLNGYAAERQIGDAVRAACLPVYHVELSGVTTDVSGLPFRYFDVIADYRKRSRR